MRRRCKEQWTVKSSDHCQRELWKLLHFYWKEDTVFLHP